MASKAIQTCAIDLEMQNFSENLILIPWDDPGPTFTINI